MADYNTLNNNYCCENKFLLTHILGKILVFKGFAMFDCWAIYNNHIDIFNSGLDMNIPGGYALGSFDGNLNMIIMEEIIIFGLLYKNDKKKSQ